MRFLPSTYAPLTALLVIAATLCPRSDLHGEELKPAIFVQGIDGSGLRRLVETPEFPAQGSPAWSRDGKRIAFDAWGNDNDNSAHVMVVQTDSTQLRDLGPGGMPSWAPDNDLLAFQQYGSNHGIWVMDSKTGEGKEQLVKLCLGAQWTRDGSRIAWSKFPDNELMVANTIDMQAIEIVSSAAGGMSFGFGWSPDGHRICGQRMINPKEYHLLVVDLTNPQHPITRVRHRGIIAGQVKWSPDGKQIVFSDKVIASGKMQLFTISPEGTDAPALVPGQDPNRNSVDPAWSPDGRQLAYSSMPGNYGL